MTPEQQAVVDRIMGDIAALVDVERRHCIGKAGAADVLECKQIVRTAIEELALRAAEAQRRCIDARNRLNAALHGPEAVIDDLEQAVGSAVARLDPGPLKGAALASQPLVPAGYLDERCRECGQMVPDVSMTDWSKLGPQDAPAAEHATDGWEAPDFRKAWQGGLTNEELEQWWRLKLPHVEATNRDICVFALGVEVGAGMGEAPKPDTALAASPAVHEEPTIISQGQLHAFLDGAAGDGLVCGGVDAADLYVMYFGDERYVGGSQEAPTNSAIRLAGLPPAEHANDFTAQEATERPAQAVVDRLMGLHMVAAHKYHLSQEFGTDAADEEAEVEAAALRAAIEELALRAADAQDDYMRLLREKQARTLAALALTDGQIRVMWSEAGGRFHGPNVETGTMPEEKLLPFLRTLSAPEQAAQQADARDAALTDAARDVLAERRRQIEVEEYTPEHDDDMERGGQLERAAAAYAVADILSVGGDTSAFLWPWDLDEFKPRDHRNNLVRASALLLAAIERWDRAMAAASKKEG